MTKHNKLRPGAAAEETAQAGMVGRVEQLAAELAQVETRLSQETARREQASAQLRYHRDIGEALIRVSHLFISTEAPDFKQVLAILSRAMAVQGAALVLFQDNNQPSIDQVYQWYDPAGQPDNRLKPAMGRLPGWLDKLEQSDCLIIPDVSALPEEAGAERAALQANGIGAVLAIPLYTAKTKRLRGYLEFNHHSSRLSTWMEEEACLLRVVANIISGHLARQEAEDAARQTIRRYHALFEAAPVMYLITRFEEKGPVVVNCNQAFLETLGYTRVEVLGRRLAAFYIPESRASLRAEVYQQAGDYFVTQEAQLLARDGRVIDTLVQAVPETDVTGRIFGARATYIDITGRKRAEVEIAALYQAEQARFHEAEALRRAALALISTVELDQVIERLLVELQQVIPYDSASVQLLKEDRMEIIGGHGFVTPALLAGFSYPVQNQTPNAQVLESREAVIIDDVALHPAFIQGPHAVAATRSWLGVPLLIGDRVIGMLTLDKAEPGFYGQAHARLAGAYAAQAAMALENARLYSQAQREIHERKQVEAALEAERASLAQRVEAATAELRLANAELARNARLKDEFLASISHELRTPLNAILGLAEGLQEQIYGSLNSKQLKHLHTIQESGQHLLALINQILDLSEIEAGKLTLQIDRIEVDPVCQASLRLVSKEAQQKGQQVSFESNLASTATLLADGRRLKQILANLLSNAVKFTPAGGSIGLVVTGAADRELIHFTVWDTGIGIAAKDVPRLFQPFSQVDSRLARQYEGAGLGLALVARLAEMHGGSVSLESTAGQGSRFTVSLPWPAGESGPGAGEAGERACAAPGPLILLAEDNETNLQTFTDYLLAVGYQVIVARDGTEAIEQARLGGPDLILMDIQMPGLDGLEATRRLKANPALTHIPIIALTALVMPGDRERCLAAGVDEYLTKPVSLKGLVQAIKVQLAGKTDQGNQA